MTAEYSVVLHAPPERVFAALTRAGELTQWWGDESVYRMTHVQQHLHAGGSANYRFAFSHGDEISGSATAYARVHAKI